MSLRKKYDLNRKVDKFIENYGTKLRDSKNIDMVELNDLVEWNKKNLRNYIETEAVYAELRHPLVYGTDLVNFGVDKRFVGECKKKFSWDFFTNLNHPKFEDSGLADKDVENCVIYRIIERSGHRDGSRRGLLYAREMELSIDVPVQYSVDWSDPYLAEFLAPLMPELDLDMLCPAGYFMGNLKEVKLEDVIARLGAKEAVIKARNRVGV
ncbi:hypothetical protein GOV06_03125 [Candidatus Woesearchaeota archaeon]|nr:hypothetical protein [Candidatus Woesearchaeota archaeon]